MPELIDQMYCSQQIIIPPKFPYILKRYCKAAIKTQPYDLLRWSFEYFKALAEKRAPPVKLRLEYPVYSTEGGLTRGCLKVLANQLAGQDIVPLTTVRNAWQGFCLDPEELRRVFCLCEVYTRVDTVPFLNFIAVAAGLLTKSLTHTMILLCETLTKEPDGGSAAIPVGDFLTMYKFLARMNASKEIKFINGYREGWVPPQSNESIEEEVHIEEAEAEESSEDEFWNTSPGELMKLAIIDDHVPVTTRLSLKANQPIVGKIERSPSAERAGEIERENYMRDRKGNPRPSEEINARLRAMSAQKFGSQGEVAPDATKPKTAEPIKEDTSPTDITVEIHVFDENDEEVEFEFYGEPVEKEKHYYATATEFDEEEPAFEAGEEETKVEPTEKEKIAEFVKNMYDYRDERLLDVMGIFDEIAAIVDRAKSAHYDLGMVAGRQMSITSGEFIVQHIEREILEYIDEQIAILPDPDLKKKKAKPEEVEMIRQLLEEFLDENMDVIVPEIEQVEEEEEAIPEVVTVYAVPGIGPPVDEEIIREVRDYALDVCKVQGDLFMPRNIRHFMCPPLEKYVEYKYEEETTKTKDQNQRREEVTSGGGTIAD